ncbi:hypothetical protein ACF0H5_011818 [Mactra antiquata]
MLRISLLLSVLIGLSQQACDPAQCVLPDCRCYDDPNQPGGLETTQIPQIIMVSFEGTISSANLELYRGIFADVTNPNGCPGRGTFFIEDEGTNYGSVRNLAMEGHEIGIQSVNGISPNDSSGWIEAIRDVRAELDDLVDINKVLGVRAPSIAMGGNDELIGIGLNNMLYDSSCSNVDYSDSGTFLWPYTFDNMPTVPCTNGDAPVDPFKGKWEVMIADLHDKNGDPCVVPSGCREVTTKRDAFELLFGAFDEHYSGKRTPFNLIIDPAWAANENFNAGTVEFLQYVRASFGVSTYLFTSANIFFINSRNVSMADNILPIV